jgi:hypothetical protein
MSQKLNDELALMKNLIDEATKQGMRWFWITFTDPDMNDFWGKVLFHYPVPLGVEDFGNGEYLVVW